jgi:hypothetical protein
MRKRVLGVLRVSEGLCNGYTAAEGVRSAAKSCEVLRSFAKFCEILRISFGVVSRGS